MYRLLDRMADCSGHGPVHLLVDSAAEIGFQWERLGLPVLSNLAGPVQHFRSAVLESCRSKATPDLCAWKGFRGGPWLDISGTSQLRDSDHVPETD